MIGAGELLKIADADGGKNHLKSCGSAVTGSAVAGTAADRAVVHYTVLSVLWTLVVTLATRQMAMKTPYLGVLDEGILLGALVVSS